MLTIKEKLPIKKMALYGSMAMLVGFAGTYTTLREMFPYDSRDNLADVSSERRQAARGSVIKPVTEASDEKSTDTSKDALKESGMVVSEAPSATQQSANRQTLTTPSSDNGPITATPSVTPTPPVVAPASTPAPQPEPQPIADPVLIEGDEPVAPVVLPIERTTDSIIDVPIQP